LVDSQLRTALLRGNMSDAHPKVQAAAAAEEEISRNLSDELAVAVRGVEVELKLTSARVDSLTAQLQDTGRRLDKLAAVRAKYSNLNDEILHRQQNMQAAVENLAEARASRAAASSSSLIALIDTPDTGSSPVGPGRLTLVLAGILGGLAVGVGVVLLTTSVASPRQAARDQLARDHAAAASGQQGDQSAVSLKQALARLAQRRALWN
jgi:uncharacterized protein involved in exopolysaccharide biosynthesis